MIIAFTVFLLLGSFTTALYDFFSCRRHGMIYNWRLSGILALSSWLGLAAIILYERRYMKR